MNRIILSILLCLAVQTASPRKLTVISVSGRCVVVENTERKLIKPGLELSDEVVVSIPYNASLDLVDREAGRQYHIKTPGRNQLTVFLADKKNGMSAVTKRYLNYVTEQMNGTAKRAQRAHSDAATITREVATYNGEKEGSEEDDEWDVEKWKQEFEEFADKNRQEYEEFRQQIIKEYEEFRAEINQQYAEFLADPWQEFKREEPEPQPKEPEVEPLVIPKNDKNRLPPVKSVPIKVKDENIKILELPTPQPLPVLPIVQENKATVVDTVVIPRPDPMPEPVIDPEVEGEHKEFDPLNPTTLEPVKDETQPFNPNPMELGPVELAPWQPLPAPVGHEVMFFGTKLYVRYAPETSLRLTSLNEADIAEAWRTLSGDDFNNTIADCLTIRHQMHLSDWAYLQLLQCVTNTLLGENTNEAALLLAYIYCQSGYKMRMGKTGNRLYMLFASRHDIYNHDYYILNGENFYPLNCKEETLSICTLPYPDEQALSLVLTEEPVLAEDATPVRKLANDISPRMQADVSVNKNLINFYETYPSSEIGGDLMTRWAMYANTPMAKGVCEQLYPSLKEQLAGLSKKDAVEKLLAFVQHSLEYKYDDEVWGRDRAFFAEESLFYPYADCEDRSILFSRLVRDLVGLPVALVFYPGHLATAVSFGGQVAGDYIPIKNEQFVVCDPTYIGAPIGRSMPGLDNNGIQVIVLK